MSTLHDSVEKAAVNRAVADQIATEQLEDKLAQTGESSEASAPKPVMGMKKLGAKKPRNKNGTEVDIETNVRRVAIDRNQPIYKYAVIIEILLKLADNTVKPIEVSKSRRMGTEHEQNKAMCAKVYRLATARIPQFGAGGQFFYDRQACLYSLVLLQDVEKIRFTVTEGVSERPNFVEARFRIEKVKESFQSSTNDVRRTFNASPALVDRTLLEALNVIASEAVAQNANVIPVGKSFHYLLNAANVNIRLPQNGRDGRYGAVGISKAVKPIQGGEKIDGSEAVLAISNELKTTLFHPRDSTLVDVFRTFAGFRDNLDANSDLARKILQSLRYVDVYCAYGRNANSVDERVIVKVRTFGASANNIRIPEKGMNVTEYFRNTYAITLRYPSLMTVEVRGRDGKKNYFPAELLRICPNQPVRTEQMIDREQADMIRLSAAKPQVRYDNTNQVIAETGIANHDFLRLSPPERVKGILLLKPTIMFGENRVVHWRVGGRGPATDFQATGKFFRPMKLSNWEAVFVAGEENQCAVTILTKAMQNMGMTVEPHATSTIRTAADLDGVFHRAKQNGRQFLLFITKSRYDFHQEIKALERKYEIVTQDIRSETADRLENNSQTKQNIINKTNIKLSGLNYEIQNNELKDPTNLFIGFETSSSAGEFVSVGFAANMLAHPQQFAGGFKFVKKSGEIYKGIIKETIHKLFVLTLTNRSRVHRTLDPNVLLKHVYVYFNGVSEGQYALINEVYAEEVSEAIQMIKNFKPKFSIIASSKSHNERFFLYDRNVINLEPGTVIDHTIVSPVHNEWFHVGAVARQGTAKAVKYCLIGSSDPDITMEKLETTTHYLCFLHEIVFQPTSLPAPLFIAGESSQRGTDLLAFHQRELHGSSIEAINEKLAFYGQELQLFGSRFNA
ncbi:unnamed protein product [Caenorhabditis sp. 36 PRJEB53466]|nr:unnamed protein product [Caenorhabditis sp. 36 PRJEB53466]